MADGIGGMVDGAVNSLTGGALPAGYTSKPYGTGGDPRNAGTWVPGRYTGAELYNMMQQLPPEAQFAFYSAMIGQGQGGNDLQSAAIRGFGGLDNLNRWINKSERDNLGSAYWNPATGEYTTKGSDGAWSTGKLANWNTSPYQGTFSSIGGEYGGDFSMRPTAKRAAMQEPGGGEPREGASGGSIATPGGSGNLYSGIAGGINAAVPPTGVPPAPDSPEFLATKAKEILGQYAKYKPDGTLDYSAMSGANGQAFWDSLPTNVKNAMQEFGLGKKMQAAATQGGPTPPGFPSGGGPPGGGGGFTPGQGPAAGAGGSINPGQGGTNPAPQPGTTPLPGQGTTTGPGMVTRQLPFDLQALLGKIKVNAAAAGGPNQPSGSSGGGNPAGGGSNYPGLDNAPRGFPTPSGRELRSFDPSYLIQQMRAKFGAKGGAGQSNSIPLAQGQGAPQNNLIAWDNIFRKPL